MKKTFKSCMILLVLFFPVFLTDTSAAGNIEKMDISACLRLYEGFRGETSSTAKVISSYYLKQLSREDVFSDIETTKEENTL